MNVSAWMYARMNRQTHNYPLSVYKILRGPVKVFDLIVTKRACMFLKEGNEAAANSLSAFQCTDNACKVRFLR